MSDTEILKKRIAELARKAYAGSYFLFSDFLGLLELSLFEEARRTFPETKCTIFGGAVGAERVMVRFGDPEEIGYEEPFPLDCLKIEPVAKKFADKLTHRDFLGALLNLGIERTTLGDIPIIDNVGYLFCKADISDYIIAELKRVKHTDVKLSRVTELPEGELYKTERILVQAEGERLDGIVAKVFKISRDDSLSYFKRRLMFVNGREAQNNSKPLAEGDTVSVRGLGRFIYRGYSSTTRKGKLNIEIDKFI